MRELHVQADGGLLSGEYWGRRATGPHQSSRFGTDLSEVLAADVHDPALEYDRFLFHRGALLVFEKRRSRQGTPFYRLERDDRGLPLRITRWEQDTKTVEVVGPNGYVVEETKEDARRKITRKHIGSMLRNLTHSHARTGSLVLEGELLPNYRRAVPAEIHFTISMDEAKAPHSATGYCTFALHGGVRVARSLPGLAVLVKEHAGLTLGGLMKLLSVATGEDLGYPKEETQKAEDRAGNDEVLGPAVEDEISYRPFWDEWRRVQQELRHSRSD